ncbi:hypothetical protein F2Q69_00020806 [Brassica cretica]|uniref:RNase H type-1 domain-containing protein n=1 Tax=Brassica cretica TaxID=69181 RepID=A0A8S9QFY4_BRACR|nr:hypothetical protein F2Q69_00020806 [Brassica cretica]
MSVESLPVSQRSPWVLWTIWKNRNQVLYADCQDSLVSQVTQASEEARTWNELNMEQTCTEPMSGLMGENRRWDPPLTGTVKCNIHSNWRNAKLHSGGAYVIRDHRGDVLHHAREAFTFSPNRLTSELRCLEWALQSMKDLGYQDVVLGLICMILSMP